MLNVKLVVSYVVLWSVGLAALHTVGRMQNAERRAASYVSLGVHRISPVLSLSLSLSISPYESGSSWW